MKTTVCILATATLLCLTPHVLANPPGHRPPVGYVVNRLPAKHVRVKGGRHSYFFHDGLFYERRGKSYVVVRPVVGVRVGVLPAGYISFRIGPARYFHFGGTFYVKDGDDYVVVDAPPGAEQYVSNPSEDLIIYPAEGQSEEQISRDRYECHRWAFETTGFDPSARDPDYALKPDYNRAMSACLEARGYVIR
ncbi:DUF6515 family protein [Elongatibacter sediminis]|uniref:DUF6515 family protein n=1 Tax=Elongatibacter sediminis TaxID=3119006 RepID=A0AAW9RL66_9GAMM